MTQGAFDKVSRRGMFIRQKKEKKTMKGREGRVVGTRRRGQFGTIRAHVDAARFNDLTCSTDHSGVWEPTRRVSGIIYIAGQPIFLI